MFSIKRNGRLCYLAILSTMLSFTDTSLGALVQDESVAVQTVGQNAGDTGGAGDTGDANAEVVPWISEEMLRRLSLADNGAELLATFGDVEDVEQRRAIKFLIENLQITELFQTDPKTFVEEVALACQTRKEMPWGASIPDELFLNDVLPWFNVDEPRENWRKMLHEKAKVIVAECKTPAEAAQRLNERLFKELGVKYSTKRKRANQAPSESIEQGLASCTGLSILLSDACRSVCVPARLAAIPSWPNKRGNHTWVEIWDETWHFAGAAEPDPKGLNRAWFVKDAATAIKDSRMNSIYAISFKKTDTVFPIVWDLGHGTKVYAINVTENYTETTTAEKNVDRTAGKTADKTADKTTNKTETPEKVLAVETRVRVWNHDRTQRIEAGVTVVAAFVPSGADAKTHTGKTTGNEADMNNMLELSLRPETQYRFAILHEGGEAVYPVRTGKHKTQLVELTVGALERPALSVQQTAAVRDAVVKYFVVDPESREEFPADLNKLLLSHPESVREIVRDCWLSSPAAEALKESFEKNEVTFGDYLSPYTVKQVGERPEGGWPLVIAMHGGGGAPKQINDRQWRQMQIYYKDHPEAGGYQYLALRAPNDKWNGFYDDYVYPLVENLIKQMVAHGDVDPSRVMLIGYSHGGYGAFSIGPKIPYRFAAIHASASAPTDGSTSVLNLRNTRFSFMVGELDTAHGRIKRCRSFAEEVAQLHSEKATACTEFPVEFLYQAGKRHGGLPDRDILPNLYPWQRNATPRRLTWHQTDAVVKRHFWLTDSDPQKGKVIAAEIANNEIKLKVSSSKEGKSFDAKSVTVQLDHRLVDLEKLVKLNVDGRSSEARLSPSLKALCDTMEETGDVDLAFFATASVEGELEAKGEATNR